MAFLNFMWRSAQLEFIHHLKIAPQRRSSKTILQIKQVRDIFEKEVHVAASVPTVWPSFVQDRYLALLHKADFPNTTAIVSEAKSAATAYVNKSLPSSNQPQESQNTVVTDMGGSTVNIVCIREFFQGGERKIGEIMPAIGSQDGSLKLNTMLEERLRREIGTDLPSVLESLGLSEDDFFQQIRDGFEVQKRKFDNSYEYTYCEIKLRFSKRVDTALINLPPLLRLQKRILRIGRAIVKDVFDEWLAHVVQLIRGAVVALKRKTSLTSRPLHVLCGKSSFLRR